MKLTCIRYHRDLTAYADGELPPKKAARIKRHVLGCEACSRQLEELSRLSGLAPPAAIEPGPDFDRVFWTRLANERRQSTLPAREHLFFSTKSFFTSPAGLSLSVGLAMGIFAVSLYCMRPAGPVSLAQHELFAAAELELYSNFDVIQNSEALENFELIEMLGELAQDEQG